MSPRPPPKISLRHEWTRELASKVVQQPEGEAVRQPEGEVARLAKFYQPTQPTPNPIRDRSGQLGITKDGRNTSRSQEINVNSFHEELSSSDRTGPLVTDTIAVQDNPQVCHEADTLNVDDEVLRKKRRNPLLFMTRIMNR